MQSDGPLDTLLPRSKQYSFHRMLATGSFFSGVIPDDPWLKSSRYRKYKNFSFFFLLSICIRTVIECFLDQTQHLDFFLWLGDFKIWWGKQYVVNQVVFIAAVFIVPVYSFINIVLVCPRDYKWTVPFHYTEGLKTGREIKFEDEEQLTTLYKKIKSNYYRSLVLMHSDNFTYFVCVFATYYLFYKHKWQVWTLGVFWTIYETYWSTYIAQNMGIFPACLEVVTLYSKLRYKKIQSKLESIKDDLYKKRTSYRGALFRLRPLLIEINEVNTSLLDYNHYWRKITMTIFTSYITQMLFITYASVFFDIGTNVLLFTLTMIVNMFLLLSALCIDSATVVSRAYEMKRPLNDIYIKVSADYYWSANNNKKQMPAARNDRFTQRHLIKLSTFIEQYNYKHMGIFLYDFYRIDWNFYYEVCVNFIVYFLLIADVLH